MATERNPNIASGKTNVPFVSGAAPSKLAIIAEGAANLAELGVGVYNMKKVDELEQEVLTEQTEALDDFAASQQQALEAQREMQNLDPKDFGTLQELQAHMSSLQAAAVQGTRTFTELKIRQEKILRDYMRRHPHLKAEFNQAAAGVLGYQPLGAEMRAAEAAAQAAMSRGGGGLPDFTEQILSHGESLGISRHRYATNPRQYWREYQFATAIEQDMQHHTRMKERLVAMDAYNLENARPFLEGAMSNLTAALWSGYGSPEGQVSAVGIVGQVVDGMLREMGMTQEGIASLQSAPGTIYEKLGSGNYERMKVELAGRKERFLRNIYNQHVWSEDSEGNKSRPLMSFKDFREQYGKEADAAFDFALEYYGNAPAAEVAKQLAEARQAEIINRMPTSMLGIKIINDMFGPDTVVGQMLLKGRAFRATAEIIYGNLPLLGIPVGGEPPPRAEPEGDVDTEPTADTWEPPQRAKTVPTPAEMALRSPQDWATLDHSYRQAVDASKEWLTKSLESGNVELARVATYLPVGYSTMLERSESQPSTFLEELGFGNRPSGTTDEAVLAMVADPNWVKAWELGWGQPPSESAATDTVEKVITDVVNRNWGEELAVLRNLFSQPENVKSIQAIRARRLASAAPGRSGPPAVPENFAVSMLADYVTFDINPETQALTYSTHRSTPEAFKDYVDFVTSIATAAGSSKSRRMLVKAGQAYSNIYGTTFQQSMRAVLFG